MWIAQYHKKVIQLVELEKASLTHGCSCHACKKAKYTRKGKGHGNSTRSHIWNLSINNKENFILAMENIVLESIKHGHKHWHVDTTFTDKG